MVRQIANGAAVVASTALAVGLYPPIAVLVGAVVVIGSVGSAIYLLRIYGRSTKPVMFQAVVSLVIGVTVVGAWLIVQQVVRALTGMPLPSWVFPINVGFIVALLAIPIYWAWEIYRLRRASA